MFKPYIHLASGGRGERWREKGALHGGVWTGICFSYLQEQEVPCRAQQLSGRIWLTREQNEYSGTRGGEIHEAVHKKGHRSEQRNRLEKGRHTQRHARTHITNLACAAKPLRACLPCRRARLQPPVSSQSAAWTQTSHMHLVQKSSASQTEEHLGEEEPCCYIYIKQVISAAGIEQMIN